MTAPIGWISTGISWCVPHHGIINAGRSGQSCDNARTTPDTDTPCIEVELFYKAKTGEPSRSDDS